MFEFIIISILTLLLGVFLYFGYKQDYKRNPKEFMRTLIGMPIGMLLGGLGFRKLDDKIKKWALDETRSQKKKRE